MKIALASKNTGKLREIVSILSGVEADVVAFDEVLPDWDSPAEGDTSFADNALLKARDLAEKSGVAALADDSGLEVDALGGKPGVLSSRFGGEGTSDCEKNQLLLQKLGKSRCRTARFICVAALALPDGRYWLERGALEGSIARVMEGDKGFGYDPVFIPSGYSHSLAALGDGVKNRISHRHKAFAKMKAVIEELLAD